MAVHPVEILSATEARERNDPSALHPLAPLSAAEVDVAVQLLKELPLFNPSTRVISIMLKEPAKERVYEWPDVAAPDREARAVCFDNSTNQAYTIDLNLASGASRVEAAPKGSQPTMSVDEQIECEQAVLNSKEFQEAILKHHGITDPSLVMVDIWSAGNYGSEEDSGTPPGAATLFSAQRSDR